jgi:hypothetical protein
VPAADGVTALVPLVANAPLQLPEALQPVALIDDQVSVTGVPTATEVADAEIAGAPGGISANAASAWTKP